MKQTQNYQLNQWEMTDLIKMEDFNSDNAKVDAALKTLAGQVASKANSSTVSSLSAVVNAKAAQSDLTAAVNRVTALESGKADKTALAAEQTARENADNAEKAAREAADTALDSRLTAVEPRSGAQKLYELTLSANTNTVDISLAGLDWGVWKKVYFFFEPYTSDSQIISLYYNTAKLVGISGNQEVERASRIMYALITMTPFFSSNHVAVGVVERYGSQSDTCSFNGNHYYDVTQLQIKCSAGQTMKPGTVFEVWGEK